MLVIIFLPEMLYKTLNMSEKSKRYKLPKLDETVPLRAAGMELYPMVSKGIM